MANPQHEDDLFRHSTMTFGEHLEELRRRLFRAVLWLALGTVVGFIVGGRVVEFISSPLENALRRYYQNEALERIRAGQQGTIPSDDEELVASGFIYEQLYFEPAQVARELAREYPDQFRSMGSLPELRLRSADLHDPQTLATALRSIQDNATPTPARRIWEKFSPAEQKTVLSLADGSDAPELPDRLADALDHLLADRDFCAEPYFDPTLLPRPVRELLERRKTLSPGEILRLNWLALHSAIPWFIAAPHPDLTPMTVWHKTKDDPRIQPSAFGMSEGFIVWMKASILTGFILVSPMIFRELWLFVAAGLYPHERRYVQIFLPFSIGLFLAGVGMAFFVVFPKVLDFLLGFNQFLGIKNEPRINDWLSFVLFLPLAFGIGFQLPLVMLFANRIGLITVRTYLAQWRIAILAIFVIAMILTPSPDVYSMMLLAAPMTLLYFGGIALPLYNLAAAEGAGGGMTKVE